MPTQRYTLILAYSLTNAPERGEKEWEHMSIMRGYSRVSDICHSSLSVGASFRFRSEWTFLCPEGFEWRTGNWHDYFTTPWTTPRCTWCTSFRMNIHEYNVAVYSKKWNWQNERQSDIASSVTRLLTIIPGMYFILFQLIEYITSLLLLILSTFFIATGFHRLHLIVGILFLLFRFQLNSIKLNNVQKFISHSCYYFTLRSSFLRSGSYLVWFEENAKFIIIDRFRTFFPL